MSIEEVFTCDRCKSKVGPHQLFTLKAYPAADRYRSGCRDVFKADFCLVCLVAMGIEPVE